MHKEKKKIKQYVADFMTVSKAGFSKKFIHKFKLK
jgi:hypothetical protein